MKTIGRIASLVILVAAIAMVFPYKGGKSKADVIRRVGPDKGGHWEVVKK